MLHSCLVNKQNMKTHCGTLAVEPQSAHFQLKHIYELFNGTNPSSFIFILNRTKNQTHCTQKQAVIIFFLLL